MPVLSVVNIFRW